MIKIDDVVKYNLDEEMPSYGLVVNVENTTITINPNTFERDVKHITRDVIDVVLIGRRYNK